MPIIPSAKWKPVAAHGGPMAGHRGLVMHSQEGMGSPFGWFGNPKAKSASATWWIAKAGGLEQYVDSGLMAYAQMAGNPFWNSCEFEGFTTEPLTTEQIVTGAGLYAWGRHIHGWPLQLAESPSGTGFGWHGMGADAWGHPFCPGAIRRNQRGAILVLAGGPPATAKAASVLLNKPIVAVVATPSDKGYWLVAADGGVFTFGDAPYLGSEGAAPLASPITCAIGTRSGAGLTLVAADGGVFTLGDATFAGSVPGLK